MNELTQLMFSHYYEKDVYYTLKVVLICSFCIRKETQAALEKNPVVNESVTFSFSVNCSFNNTFSL